MRRLVSAIQLAVLLTLATGFGGGAALQPDPYEPGFDGTWTGSLRRLDPNTHNPVAWDEAVSLPNIDISIEIKGASARVFVKQAGQWVHVKPGAFATLMHKTNAIVAAIDSNILPDRSAGWVETWNLTLTHKENDSLYVYWVRAVNNYVMPADSDPSARFFMSAFGEMRRTGRTLVQFQQQIPVADARPAIACLKTDLVCDGAPAAFNPRQE